MIVDQFFHSKGPLKSRRESLGRSAIKAISWRILGTLDTVLISWIITGSFQLAYVIGSVEIATKMTLYFIHERIWNSIKWGK